MAKQKVVFSISQPFSLLADNLATDKAFAADVQRVLELSSAQFAALAQALKEYPSFLDEQAMQSVVQAVLQPHESASKLARTVWHLNRLIRDSDEPPDRGMRLLRKALEKHADPANKASQAMLGERLQQLILDPPGFERQSKAERLAYATGAELEDVQIICDVRPVFDEERTAIEGAIPVTTLRLSFAKAENQSSRLEIQLTEGQLVELLAKAQSARRKVLTIKKILAEKSISMPETSATLSKELL